jgi:hypothetical protein
MILLNSWVPTVTAIWLSVIRNNHDKVVILWDYTGLHSVATLIPWGYHYITTECNMSDITLILSWYWRIIKYIRWHWSLHDDIRLLTSDNTKYNWVHIHLWQLSFMIPIITQQHICLLDDIAWQPWSTLFLI